MKKLLFILLLLTGSSSVIAEDFGIGINTQFNLDSENISGSTATLINLNVSPALMIIFNEKLELQPFLQINYHKENDINNIGVNGENIAPDYQYINLGLGAGLYYHCIQNEIIDLAFGIKADVIYGLMPFGTSAAHYYQYFYIFSELRIPVLIDLKLTEHLIFRLSYEQLGVNCFFWSADIGGTKRSDTGVRLITSQQTNLYLTYSFFYKF